MSKLVRYVCMKPDKKTPLGFVFIPTDKTPTETELTLIRNFLTRWNLAREKSSEERKDEQEKTDRNY